MVDDGRPVAEMLQRGPTNMMVDILSHAGGTAPKAKNAKKTLLAVLELVRGEEA